MIKYPKIHPLGADENKDIFLVPDDEIIMEEKVDGANFRFVMRDGRIIFGSRTQSIGDSEQEIGGNWKRCVEYLKEKLTGKNLPSNLMFVGECMVQHSIAYDWERVPPYLGIDVMDLSTGQYLTYNEKKTMFENLDLNIVPLIGVMPVSHLLKTYPKFEDSMVPKSNYYPGPAEGIVFKNYSKQLMAKYVTDKFKEVNRETFGGGKKFAENDDERIVAMFCPNSRIDKIIFKMLDEGYKLEMQMMAELPRRVIQDIMEENWKEICMSTWSVNFRNTRKKITNRCVSVLKQIMTNQALQNAQ